MEKEIRNEDDTAIFSTARVFDSGVDRIESEWRWLVAIPIGYGFGRLAYWISH